MSDVKYSVLTLDEKDFLIASVCLVDFKHGTLLLLNVFVCEENLLQLVNVITFDAGLIIFSSAFHLISLKFTTSQPSTHTVQ